MISSPQNLVTITAQCLCKAHTFTAAVPASSLPLKATACHCNSCRHCTGALYFCDTGWPEPDVDLSALKGYMASANIELFSCGVCSAQMFCRGLKEGDGACVLTGVSQNGDYGKELVRYENHIFVGDTLDGGASMWIRRNADGSPAKRWTERTRKGEVLDFDWPDSEAELESQSGSKASGDENRKASPALTPLFCHCRGVNLLLRSAVDLEGTPAEELPFYVDPKSFKYLANTDACDSCRLFFGCDLPNWTFAGLDHIEFPGEKSTSESKVDSRPFPRTVDELKAAVSAAGSERDSRLGTLAFYQSSPDVERYFCSTCFASVFYACHDDDRSYMVAIAVGVLAHPDGARAEGLLRWAFERVEWQEDTKGGWREGVVDCVVKEMEDWSVKREYRNG
jgi:hypothetical protein